MKTKSILFVEDSPDDEALLIRVLRSLKLNCSYAVAHDGMEALDYLFCSGKHSERDIEDKPTVIFLDLNLPKLNGLEVLTKIRKDEGMKTVPVVILSSSTEEKDIKSSYVLGANSFVTKPVKFETFVETVREAAGYWLRLNELP